MEEIFGARSHVLPARYGQSNTLLDGSDWNILSSLIQTISLFFLSSNPKRPKIQWTTMMCRTNTTCYHKTLSNNQFFLINRSEGGQFLLQTPIRLNPPPPCQLGLCSPIGFFFSTCFFTAIPSLGPSLFLLGKKGKCLFLHSIRNVALSPLGTFPTQWWCLELVVYFLLNFHLEKKRTMAPLFFMLIFFHRRSCMRERGYVMQPRMTCRRNTRRQIRVGLLRNRPASHFWLHFCLVFSC